MANLKKLFVASIILLVLFEILSGVISLIQFNILDYNETFKIVIGSVTSLVFLIGVSLCLIILIKADETFQKLKGTKIILTIYYLFSPINLMFIAIIILSFIFLNPFKTLIFLIPSIILISSIWFFKTNWSKNKKILFAIYQIIIGLTTALLIFISPFLESGGSLA